jgi:hypothetical protein
MEHCNLLSYFKKGNRIGGRIMEEMNQIGESYIKYMERSHQSPHV